MKQLLFSIIFICISYASAYSQTEVLNLSDSPYTIESLILNDFANAGIDIVNVTYTGNEIALGQFNNADPSIGINQGIALSTGEATDIFGVNCPAYCTDTGNLGLASGNTSGLSDPDLADFIVGSNVNDAAILEIDFIPVGDFIEFNYLFASEEYQNYTCSNFNDGFGILLSGPGISGTFSNNAKNIANIPGTNIPVSINSVNSGIPTGGYPETDCISLNYSQYFVNNITTGLTK